MDVMDKEIHVEVKTPYGRENYYPRCEFSVFLCKVLDRKGFGRDEIVKIHEGGVDIYYTGKSRLLETLGAFKE
jgi:hypothetical protein